MRSVSVIVPVYNSAMILPDLIERLKVVAPTISDQLELILVNDNSRDNSWEVIREQVSIHTWIRGFNLMRNYGQHNALLCGIRQARYEIAISMDDDLQHPPEELHKILTKLEEGYDVVYGTPAKEQHGLWRNLASQITKLALRGAMGVDAARNVSALRAFRTKLRDAFADFQGPFVSIDVLLTWGTTRFAHVPVAHAPRAAGISNYTFRKLLTHALNMITGFSILPLQLASLVGFSFTLLGMALLVYVLARYIIAGDSVPGFPFLASMIAIFSGAQMFALGIIGEYMARMHYKIMAQPAYTLRDDAIPQHEEPLTGQRDGHLDTISDDNRETSADSTRVEQGLAVVRNVDR